jgi:hypothetical protein
LRAERKAGELLAQREMAKGGQPYQSGRSTLTDLGITRDQSSQWQKLAAEPSRPRSPIRSESHRPTSELPRI